jgi:hypothetical protein
MMDGSKGGTGLLVQKSQSFSLALLVGPGGAVHRHDGLGTRELGPEATNKGNNQPDPCLGSLGCAGSLKRCNDNSNRVHKSHDDSLSHDFS